MWCRVSNGRPDSRFTCFPYRKTVFNQHTKSRVYHWWRHSVTIRIVICKLMTEMSWKFGAHLLKAGKNERSYGFFNSVAQYLSDRKLTEWCDNSLWKYFKWRWIREINGSLYRWSVFTIFSNFLSTCVYNFNPTSKLFE